MFAALASQIERDGFAILPNAFTADEVETILKNLQAALAVNADRDGSIRTGSGGVYAARNVLAFYPRVADIWKKPAVVELLQTVLGDSFGLVRVLFFDKPPERSWNLPWHKDMTIAVAEPDGSQTAAYKIHRKSGVPHIEPPTEVLDRMLTLRLHLEDVTKENGPLRVVTGSHRTGKRLTLDDGPQVTIVAERGDVLAIRPLVTHCSGRSADGTQRHRRILHFEFGGQRALPDGFQWHTFVPADRDVDVSNSPRSL